MPSIRVDLNSPIYNGQTVTFKSPADCSDVKGLTIHYVLEGETLSKNFLFADAHGNNVGNHDLFASDVLVKVVLDTELAKAYVQNADTNKYIEETFFKKVVKPVPRGSHIDDIKEPGFYTITRDEGGLPYYDSGDPNYYLEVTPLGQNSVKQTIDFSECVATRKLINEVWDGWEWINPPLCSGAKYRTTERLYGKPVYVMFINVAFASTGFANDISCIPADARVIDICMTHYRGDTKDTYILPYYDEQKYVSCWIMGYKLSHSVGKYSDSDTLYAIIKYIKK